MKINQFGFDAERSSATLGAYFAYVRRRKHLTQREVEQRSGIAQTDISNLERGRKNPTLKSMLRIAQALECDLEISLVAKDGRSD